MTVPLHLSQHAYQTGKSTGTIPYALVFMIEEPFHQKGLAIGAFLDISRVLRLLGG